MTYQLRIENTGGYDDYDKKRGKSEGTPQQSESPSIHSDYQKLVAERNKRFNNYQNASRAAFDAYVRQSNANFEIYTSGATTPTPPQPQAGVPDEGQVDTVVVNQNNATVQLNPGEAPPTYGPSRAEANKNYANGITNPDNWVEAKLEPGVATPTFDPVVAPKDNPPVAPVNNPTEVENPQQVDNQNNDKRIKALINDFTSGLSPETVKYLSGDENYINSLADYIKDYMAFEEDNKGKIPQDTYEHLKEFKFGIWSTNLKNYADTIENWEDGNTYSMSFYRTGMGTVDRDYIHVTLPDGRKAFEYNGEYYQLDENGMPSFSEKIEL